jgi:hypothetical protein
MVSISHIQKSAKMHPPSPPPFFANMCKFSNMQPIFVQPLHLNFSAPQKAQQKIDCLICKQWRK